jgi:hypothetical protein
MEQSRDRFTLEDVDTALVYLQHADYVTSTFIVSQMPTSQFPSNFFVKIIGIWEVSLDIFLVPSLFFLLLSDIMLISLHFIANLNGWFSTTLCNIRYRLYVLN